MIENIWIFQDMYSQATGEENAATKQIQIELKHELINVILFVF